MNRSLKERIFHLRGVLPLPLLIALLIWAQTTPTSFFRGFVLVGLGVAIRFWAAGHIRLYRVAEVQARELVVWGPYAYVRNPLYWGNFLAGLGFTVMAAWGPGYLLFLALFLLMYAVIVPLEEEYLAGTFGAAYTAYRAEVHRLWPRLRPYRKAPRAFDFEAALRGELHTVVQYVLIAALFYLRLQRG